VKLRIELSDGLSEDEVIIRCGRVDETVQKLQEYILSLSSPKIVFFKGSQKFYIPLEDILFFETSGEQIFAHTVNDAFKVKRRLYELEELLPRSFVRAAKGTIVNTRRIYAIDRNLTSSSQIGFTGTHKQIYVSRHYYRALKEIMNERGI
jgi:DNA-binding LytR/AlgR family response regulator